MEQMSVTMIDISGLSSSVKGETSFTLYLIYRSPLKKARINECEGKQISLESIGTH